MTKNNGNGHQLHFKIHPMSKIPSETMNGWIIYTCAKGVTVHFCPPSILSSLFFLFFFNTQKFLINHIHRWNSPRSRETQYSYPADAVTRFCAETNCVSFVFTGKKPTRQTGFAKLVALYYFHSVFSG